MFSIDKVSPVLTKNELTSNIYNLWYLGAPEAFGRFPRKHSW